MVKVKVAILDDEQNDLNKVHNYFKSISSNSIQYNCDEYKQLNEQFFNYDLYVLDIELPTISGFEVAEKIKEKCPNLAEETIKKVLKISVKTVDK